VISIKRLCPSPATVIATIALLVALAGTGYAATALPANSVGNRQLQNNAVTSSKVKDHSLLKVDFASGQLVAGPRGSVGPPGPPGAAGARGPTGPAGAGGTSSLEWAVVDATGNLARSSGVLSVGHLGTGNYIVKFNKNISQCAWPATIRGSSFGMITTELLATTTDTVQVRTRDPFNQVVDRAFHLVAVC